MHFLLPNKKRSWEQLKSTPNLFSALFGTLAVLQLLFLLWLNLTQLPYHLGYDASCDYLRAYEMYRQGTLFPENWHDTTTSHLDAPGPLAALLLHIVPNLFTAFGLANCVFLLGMVGFFWLILRELNVSLWASFLGISLLLCPNYVIVANSNDLGYAACLLTSMQSYSGKFVLAFCFLWLWLVFANRKKWKAYHTGALVFCIFGCFVTGLSSGYFLAAYLLLPTLAVSFALWLMREDHRWLLGPHTALTLGSLAAVAAGKLFAEHVIGFVSKDSSMALIPLSELADNLLAALEGWFSLSAALPPNDWTTVFSSKGLLYLLGAVVTIFLLGALAVGCLQLMHTIRRTCAGESVSISSGVVLLTITMLTNLLMLGLLNTRYGSSTYEDRYLIMVYCLSILLLAHLLSEGGLHLWIFRAMTVVLLLCLTIRTAASDIAYTNTKINTSLMDAITATADALPSPVVFTCTETDEYNLMLRNMRCYDLAHVYKPIKSGVGDAVTLHERYQGEADAASIPWRIHFPHWGDYSYYDTAEEYSGPIVLIAEPLCFEALPTSLQEEFTFYSALNDDLAVYTCAINVLGV